jgi:hypothetical protein
MTDLSTPRLMELTTIPNFEGVKNFEDIQSRFIESARSIMFDHDLFYERNGGMIWQITALELYLKLDNHQDIWWDPTTHGADEQLNRGTWYIHDNGNRAPGYCGIDITAGCKKSKVYAGLLIRELNKIDGSAKALQTIIRGDFRRDRWLPDERVRIQKIHGQSVCSSPLRLIPRAKREQGSRAKRETG